MKVLIQAHDVKLFTPSYRELANKISFTLKPGECLFVEGENGSGKTTLIKSILGLHKYYFGDIQKGYTQPLYLPQLGNTSFFLPLSLIDVIQLESPKAHLRDIMNLGFFDNENSLSRPWNTASGGEKQKTLLSRIFLQPSDLIILDEPFNHLDQKSRLSVIHKMKHYCEKGGALLLVAHGPLAEWSEAKKLRIEGHL